MRHDRNLWFTAHSCLAQVVHLATSDMVIYVEKMSESLTDRLLPQVKLLKHIECLIVCEGQRETHRKRQRETQERMKHDLRRVHVEKLLRLVLVCYCTVLYCTILHTVRVAPIFIIRMPSGPRPTGSRSRSSTNSISANRTNSKRHDS